ncbi:MAG: hypothetical protein U0872_15405 [Planctomycetaceae bacterium]
MEYENRMVAAVSLTAVLAIVLGFSAGRWSAAPVKKPMTSAAQPAMPSPFPESDSRLIVGTHEVTSDGRLVLYLRPFQGSWDYRGRLFGDTPSGKKASEMTEDELIQEFGDPILQKKPE